MVQIQVEKQILIELAQHATHQFQTEKFSNTFHQNSHNFDSGDFKRFFEYKDDFEKILSDYLNGFEIFVAF